MNTNNEKNALEEIGLLYAIAYTAERLSKKPTDGYARQAAFARATAELLTQEYCERQKQSY